MGNFCGNHPILTFAAILSVCYTVIRSAEILSGTKHSPLVNIKFGGKEIFDISKDEDTEEFKEIKKKPKKEN